jgi:phage terminase small subunit
VTEILEEKSKELAKTTAKAAKAALLSKTWVIEKLVENANVAMERREGAVANRALELLGKELGMFIERSEHGGPGDFDRMSEAELQDYVRRGLGLLGADKTEH